MVQSKRLIFLCRRKMFVFGGGCLLLKRPSFDPIVLDNFLRRDIEKMVCGEGRDEMDYPDPFNLYSG